MVNLTDRVTNRHRATAKTALAHSVGHAVKRWWTMRPTDDRWIPVFLEISSTNWCVCGGWLFCTTHLCCAYPSGFSWLNFDDMHL